MPTAATATIVLCPGIAAALALTRQSAEFEHLQRAIGLLGSTDPYLFPTESVFREAWHQVCAVYTHHAGPLLHALTRSSSDIALPRYTAVLYLLARVLGYLVVPEGPWDTHPAVAADHAVTGALEHLGPKLLNGFRAALGAPRLTAALANTVRVRSSKVLLNKVQKGPSSFSVESNNHNGWS